MKSIKIKIGLVLLIASFFLISGNEVKVEARQSSPGTECCLNGYKNWVNEGNGGFETCSCNVINFVTHTEECQCPEPE